MARKFKVPLGLAVLGEDPSSATTGDMYYNTILGTMVYNGSCEMDAPSDFILEQVKRGWIADGLRIYCPDCANG